MIGSLQIGAVAFSLNAIPAHRSFLTGYFKLDLANKGIYIPRVMLRC